MKTSREGSKRSSNRKPIEHRYDKLILALFNYLFRQGKTELEFTREQLVATARKLNFEIKNIGDVVYTYQSRRPMPLAIRSLGEWIIRSKGTAKYSFQLLEGGGRVAISPHLEETEIPHAIPEIVERHVPQDEQGSLTKARYNRLIDVFTRLTAFHLQSHIRTQLVGIGQIEIDDLYVALDREGKEYVIPVEAKGPTGNVNLQQIQKSILYAKRAFPKMICKPVALQEIAGGVYALFEFKPETELNKIKVVAEKKYILIREDDAAKS